MDDRHGSAPQFDANVAEHRQAVLAYARRRLQGDAAEDALAETLAIAWRKREEMPADALLWLYAIARGVIANLRRSESRRQHLAARLAREPGIADGDPAGLVADRLELARAFDALEESDRELLMLVAWEGLSPRQGAKVLGCSAAAFRVRVHRARRRLEQGLVAAPPAPGGERGAERVSAVKES
jgi:RNA polymerase sigma-70 factor (ECF subfamily)